MLTISKIVYLSKQKSFKKLHLVTIVMTYEYCSVTEQAQIFGAHWFFDSGPCTLDLTITNFKVLFSCICWVLIYVIHCFAVGSAKHPQGCSCRTMSLIGYCTTYLIYTGYAAGITSLLAIQTNAPQLDWEKASRLNMPLITLCNDESVGYLKVSKVMWLYTTAGITCILVIQHTDHCQIGRRPSCSAYLSFPFVTVTEKGNLRGFQCQL